MKHLRFKNVWLLSRKEGTARIEDLNSNQMAIIGDNGTGKSSLIKSLYAAFGADPVKIHPEWRDARVEIRLDFDIDGKPFTIVRKANHFGIFDADRKPIIRTRQIVSELAPCLAELLDFRLKMTKKNPPEVITPPPAFCFLPFYMDQDSSWETTWSGFTGLSMMKDARKEAADYHSGRRPNEYYEALAEKQEADLQTKELTQENEALKRAKARFDEKKEKVSFDLKPEEFGDRIEALLVECEEIQAQQDKTKSELLDLSSERVLFSEQVRIAKAALSELEADYRLASDLEEELYCPTCGTVHENDFVDRFSIIADADNCREIIAKGEEKIRNLVAKIHDAQIRLNKAGQTASRLRAILSEERGKLKLHDVLKGESERMLDESFIEEFDQLATKIGSCLEKSRDASKRMRKATSRQKNEAIKHTFSGFMAQFMQELDVQPLSEREASDVHGKIDSTGSDNPRALLAYKYAFFHTMLNHSSSPLCPMVIDSPLQQDQDDTNIAKILNFIIRNTPDHCQLVLGSVKLHSVKFDGKVIETNRKMQLLHKNAFQTAKEELDPFVEALLA